MNPPHRRRLGVLVGIALLAPLAAPTAAGSDPIDDKRAEAARLAEQLDEQGDKVSVATERYNRAQLRVEEVQESRQRAESDLRRSDERFKAIKGRLSQAAVVAYVHGGSNATLSRLARSSGHTDLLVRRQYLLVTASDQRALLGELRSARQDLTEVRVKLTAEEREARDAAARAAELRGQAIAAEDAQRAILARAEGELSDLVAAETARRAEEDRRRAPAPSPSPALAPVPVLSRPVADDGPAVASKAITAPPPSSRAGIAVAEAEKQIGKPYVYGGAGPDSFDCSGLTAWAWKAAGVYLSHSAYTQWFETTRVPIDQVQPGDLLFFGDDGVESIHHNAIYVGGGQMIEASQTGVPVRYRGWRAGDLVGAGRPG